MTERTLLLFSGLLLLHYVAAQGPKTAWQAGGVGMGVGAIYNSIPPDDHVVNLLKDGVLAPLSNFPWSTLKSYRLKASEIKSETEYQTFIDSVNKKVQNINSVQEPANIDRTSSLNKIKYLFKDVRWYKNQVESTLPETLSSSSDKNGTKPTFQKEINRTHAVQEHLSAVAYVLSTSAVRKYPELVSAPFTRSANRFENNTTSATTATTSNAIPTYNTTSGKQKPIISSPTSPRSSTTPIAPPVREPATKKLDNLSSQHTSNRRNGLTSKQITTFAQKNTLVTSDLYETSTTEKNMTEIDTHLPNGPWPTSNPPVIRSEPPLTTTGNPTSPALTHSNTYRDSRAFLTSDIVTGNTVTPPPTSTHVRASLSTSPPSLHMHVNAIVYYEDPTTSTVVPVPNNIEVDVPPLKKPIPKPFSIMTDDHMTTETSRASEGKPSKQPVIRGRFSKSFASIPPTQTEELNPVKRDKFELLPTSRSRMTLQQNTPSASSNNLMIQDRFSKTFGKGISKTPDPSTQVATTAPNFRRFKNRYALNDNKQKQTPGKRTPLDRSMFQSVDSEMGQEVAENTHPVTDHLQPAHNANAEPNTSKPKGFTQTDIAKGRPFKTIQSDVGDSIALGGNRIVSGLTPKNGELGSSDTSNTPPPSSIETKPSLPDVTANQNAGDTTNKTLGSHVYSDKNVQTEMRDEGHQPSTYFTDSVIEGPSRALDKHLQSIKTKFNERNVQPIPPSASSSPTDDNIVKSNTNLTLPQALLPSGGLLGGFSLDQLTGLTQARLPALPTGFQSNEMMNYERMLILKTLAGLVKTMGMLQNYIIDSKTTTAATQAQTTSTSLPTTTSSMQVKTLVPFVVPYRTSLPGTRPTIPSRPAVQPSPPTTTTTTTTTPLPITTTYITPPATMDYFETTTDTYIPSTEGFTEYTSTTSAGKGWDTAMSFVKSFVSAVAKTTPTEASPPQPEAKKAVTQQTRMNQLEDLLKGISASDLQNLVDIIKTKASGSRAEPAATATSEPPKPAPRDPAPEPPRRRPSPGFIPPPPGSGNQGPPREARRGPSNQVPPGSGSWQQSPPTMDMSGPPPSRDNMPPWARNGQGSMRGPQSQDMGGPYMGMGGPPRGMGGSPRGMGGPPRGMGGQGGPPGGMDMNNPQVARLIRVARQKMLSAGTGGQSRNPITGEAPEAPEGGGNYIYDIFPP